RADGDGDGSSGRRVDLGVVVDGPVLERLGELVGVGRRVPDHRVAQARLTAALPGDVAVAAPPGDRPAGLVGGEAVAERLLPQVGADDPRVVLLVGVRLGRVDRTRALAGEELVRIEDLLTGGRRLHERLVEAGLPARVED